MKPFSNIVVPVDFLKIVSLADESSHDFIVVGTHERTRIKHALLGSVAEKVVRKAPCPVLNVHRKEPGSSK